MGNEENKERLEADADSSGNGVPDDTGVSAGAESKATGEKWYSQLDQREARYTPISATPNEACSACRWFISGGDWGGGDECHLVMNWPDPIVPNGWCERYERTPIYDPADAEPIPVRIVKAAEKRGKFGRLGEVAINAFKALLGIADEPPELWETIASKERGFKSIGDNRWIAWFSNNFVDNEGEAFSLKAIDGWVDRVLNGVSPMPELWFAHILGTKHGVADCVGHIAGLVWATGAYDDTELASQFKVYYAAHDDLPMSHGYEYPLWAYVGGVYHYYDTFEVSPLPTEYFVPANDITSFKGVVEMAEKQLTEKQRAALLEVVGTEEKLAALISNKESQAAELKESGRGFKGLEQPPPPAAEDADARATAQAAKEAADGATAGLSALTTRVEAMEGSLKTGIEGIPTAIAEALKPVVQLITENDKAVKALLEADAEQEADAPRASQSPLLNIPKKDKQLENLIALNKSGGEQGKQKGVKTFLQTFMPDFTDGAKDDTPSK